MSVVLWQLEVSHFNEKVRWVLDYKGIPHERRTVLPGMHMVKSKRLSGGNTFPVLLIDGNAIVHSSAIVKALEDLKPQPPVYPADPAGRERALEIEADFDEFGHDLRRVMFIHFLADRNLFMDTFGPKGGPLRATAPVGWPLVKRQLERKYGVNAESAAAAERNLERHLELIERETADTGYMVGGSFSIADITAASILYPIVQPPGLQYPLPDASRMPRPLQELRAGLSQRPAWTWVLKMFAEHRGTSAEVAAAAAA